MINLAVIEMKDIVKYLVRVTVIIIALVFLTRYFLNGGTNFKNKEIGAQKFFSCLDEVIPSIKNINYHENNNANNGKKNLLKMALGVELGMLDNVQNKQTEEKEQKGEESQEELEDAQTGLKTQVQESGVKQKYTVAYNTVKVKNETDIKLDKNILTPNVNVNTKNILIYHTHSCESYTQSEKYTYKKSGNFRTTDKERSVIRVGSELTNYMKKYGYNVIHDTSLYDYPSYNGSYDRSYAGASKLLDKNKGTEVIFDIHRDAIRR